MLISVFSSKLAYEKKGLYIYSTQILIALQEERVLVCPQSSPQSCIYYICGIHCKLTRGNQLEPTLPIKSVPCCLMSVRARNINSSIAQVFWLFWYLALFYFRYYAQLIHLITCIIIKLYVLFSRYHACVVSFD